MAKLYYKFGAMKCGKTRDLIKTWYNYKEKGFGIIIIKPGDDKKAGENIQSRAHEELKADYVVPADVNLYDLISKHILDYNLHAILVDEAQFLQPHQVDELSDVVDNFSIPVMCYGLRADFQSHLFPGSQRLFEIADVLEELKAVCKCGEKATYNLRLDRNENGEYAPVFEGPQISIDGIDSDYDSVCRPCYKKLKREYKKVR